MPPDRMLSIVPRRYRCDSLNSYCLPGSSGESLIQIRCASKMRPTLGARSGCTSRSPRLMSISSSSVSVTAMSASASRRSPSNRTMWRTRLSRRDGTAMIGSPTATRPAAMVPA